MSCQKEISDLGQQDPHLRARPGEMMRMALAIVREAGA